jgi:hypothetical protein
MDDVFGVAAKACERHDAIDRPLSPEASCPTAPINQPQVQIGPIGVRVQHGPKLPPLYRPPAKPGRPK